MTRPQVSVVIPVYNQAHYVKTAIQSALSQTYRDFEIIVVDDGSTDHTAAVVQKFGDTVRYIFQTNQGLAGARNTGINAAEGDYIALLDSDDSWHPQYLAAMMALAAANPDAAAYYCGVRYIDAAGVPLPQQGWKAIPATELYNVLLRYNPLIPSAVVLKRATVIDAESFDIRFRRLQDWELWIRLLRSGRTFVGLDECLVQYRIHNTSLSTDGVGGQQAARLLVEKHFGHDDGERMAWPADKKRAYGGFFRYSALVVALLRQGDWQLCGHYLRQALQVDPTLAVDLGLYFELALGTQPAGFRGYLAGLNLGEQQANVELVLKTVFAPPAPAEVATLYQPAYATAYYALAMLAHQMQQPAVCRRLLLKAIRHQPQLGCNRNVIKLLAMSFVGRSGIAWLRQSRIQVHRLLRSRDANRARTY